MFPIEAVFAFQAFENLGERPFKPAESPTQTFATQAIARYTSFYYWSHFVTLNSDPQSQSVANSGVYHFSCVIPDSIPMIPDRYDLDTIKAIETLSVLA